MKKELIVLAATLAASISQKAEAAGFCSSNPCTGGSGETSISYNTAGPAFLVTNTDSATGSAVKGVAHYAGNTSNAPASGVAGFNTGNGGYGVYGQANGGGGIGVYGSTTGNIGVQGQSTSSGGIGVSALATHSNGTALYAEADGSSAYAVEGVSANGYAGYFSGLTEVNGNLVVEDNASVFGSLTVTGALTVSGGCTGCSDLRMKKNVKPLTGALDQLLELREVTFEWIDPTKHHHERETGTQVGFIAQDLEKIHPQWVNPEGYKSKDGETFRTIDLHEIEALEVGGIRELKMRNDALEAKTGKQQAEIDELREAVARLRNGTDPISGTPSLALPCLASTREDPRASYAPRTPRATTPGLATGGRLGLRRRHSANTSLLFTVAEQTEMVRLAAWPS
jgi:hypothetical protein